jgi:hypothetical protein
VVHAPAGRTAGERVVRGEEPGEIGPRLLRWRGNGRARSARAVRAVLLRSDGKGRARFARAVTGRPRSLRSRATGLALRTRQPASSFATIFPTAVFPTTAPRKRRGRHVGAQAPAPLPGERSESGRYRALQARGPYRAAASALLIMNVAIACRNSRSTAAASASNAASSNARSISCTHRSRPR